jgi:hypothetical protein
VKTEHARKSSLKKASRNSVPATPGGLVHLSDLSLATESASSGAQENIDIPAFNSGKDVLSWCSMLLEDSPLGRALLAFARKKGWRFELSDMQGVGFHMDAAARTCQIDHYALEPSVLTCSAYFRNAVLMSFARALRDIWHEERLGGFEDRLCPEDFLMLERIRSADGDIVAIFIGWELRAAGHADVWRYIIGSEEGDIAMVFSRLLEHDPAALFDGSVLASAFRQWHEDENRINSCDHDTLEYIDDYIQESQSRNPFGKGRLSGEVLESLSCLPGGIVYLQGLGEAVLSDPFYAGLKEFVNQTHFMHILHDLKAVMAGGVAFQDHDLARKIFPENQPASPKVV